ncbi:MAG: hypothetical protein KY475_27845, partial [Planctomycetes bacterium]|nr:hypothetical protein [Planctomycetota bacterium]
MAYSDKHRKEWSDWGRMAAPYLVAIVSVGLAVGLKAWGAPWVEEELGPFVVWAAAGGVGGWSGGG